jgi:hypothetical protein
MAHLLAPQPSHPSMPVFFNVDGVVGAAPAQNEREDVLLVQFILRVIAKSPDAMTEPQLQGAFGSRAWYLGRRHPTQLGEGRLPAPGAVSPTSAHSE